LSQRRQLAGLALAIFALAVFATSDTLSQVVLNAGAPLLAVVFIRFAVQAVATSLLAVPLRGRAMFQTEQRGLQILRGMTLVMGTSCLFASLRFMTVGEMTAIMMLTPMAVTAIAGLLFKEVVPPLRWLLLVGGFAGTLVILRPGTDDFRWVMLLPLGQVVFNTVFQLLTSRLSRTEHPVTTNLYTSLTCTVLTLPALVLADMSHLPGWVWGLTVGLGLSATLGHMLWVMAFQRVPATQVMPFTYSQIAFAVLAGWVATGAVPDRWAAVGMGAIALCGIGSALLTLNQQRR
jgi:drug/metabolite transporter (DMT)-like permease